MFAGMRVAGRGLHAHHETQPRQHVGVMHVARPPRLLRIAADDGAFLVPVKWLHRRVDVDDVALAETWERGRIEMSLQPVEALPLGDRGQAVTQRVLAHDLRHAQQLGQHLVAAQRRHMGVTLVPCECRQHPRAGHVANLRGVRARVGQRAVRDRRIEPARHLQERGEIDELTERRQRARWIPVYLDRATECVQRLGAGCTRLNRQLIIRRVKPRRQSIVCHGHDIARFLRVGHASNCRF